MKLTRYLCQLDTKTDCPARNWYVRRTHQIDNARRMGGWVESVSCVEGEPVRVHPSYYTIIRGESKMIVNDGLAIRELIPRVG